MESRRNRWGRVIEAMLVGVLLWLALRGEGAQASPDWQTIPTAPPPTATATDVPANTPRKTATLVGPIGGGATQTTGPTLRGSQATATDKVVRNTSTSVPNQTLSTSSPTEISHDSPTGTAQRGVQIPAQDVEVERAGGNGVYVAIGGGLLLLALGGLALLRSKRR